MSERALGRAIAAMLAIVALVVLGLLIWLWPVLRVLTASDRTAGNFRLGSEAMLPTLQVGDVVRPRRARPGDLRRGAVILFSGFGPARAGRIVALPGDRFAMARGHVVLNGHVVPFQTVGRGPGLDGGSPTVIEREILPGEPGAHRILDAGASPGDDTPELVVPASRLVVLGDDRDRSADSRFGPEDGGTGLVATGAVIGVVDLVVWSQGFHDRVHPVDRP